LSDDSFKEFVSGQLGALPELRADFIAVQKIFIRVKTPWQTHSICGTFYCMKIVLLILTVIALLSTTGCILVPVDGDGGGHGWHHDEGRHGGEHH